MAVRITVVGTGYVGLIQAVGLADFGNYVTGVDIRPEIVSRLSAGEPTIFEHGLPEYLQRNVRAGRLKFITEAGAAIAGAEVVYIAVGTPEAKGGSADLSQIQSVVADIAEHARGFTVIVTKSTVPVGPIDGLPRSLRARPARRQPPMTPPVPRTPASSSWSATRSSSAKDVPSRISSIRRRRYPRRGEDHGHGRPYQPQVPAPGPRLRRELLPKDTKAVVSGNEAQKEHTAAKVRRLPDDGATIHVHDPKALDNLRSIFSNQIACFHDEFDCLTGADCAVI